MKTLLVLIIGLISASYPCRGSTLEPHTLTATQVDQIQSLSKKSLIEQIQEIKKTSDIELLTSSRKVSKTYFDSLGPAKRSVEDITDIEGLYGKAVCPRGFTGRSLILIASDAPPSTLMHQFIHALQMRDNRRWCQLEGRVLEPDEKKDRAILYHSFEFEVLKTLWDLREQLQMNVEDHLILVEGLSRENKVFVSMDVQALDKETASEVEKESEEASVQIEFFKWLTRSPVEASSVLQKMEIIGLKSCVEKTVGLNEAEKINKCLTRRCEYSNLRCPKVTETDLKDYDGDLISKIIFAWVRPSQIPNCGVPNFKDEFVSALETPTECWKTWYDKRGSSQTLKSLRLKPLLLKEVVRRFSSPPLSIDRKISFFESPNPESLINRTYCYFVFQKIIRFESLPVDQFPFSVLGTSLSVESLPDYKKWLDQDKMGKLCTRIVKLFTGQEPSIMEGNKGIKYLLVINPIGAISGGIPTLKSNLALDINHQRLHFVYADNSVVRAKVRAEWGKLTKQEQDEFKKLHVSYDLKNEEVLLKEYFSYSRQQNPQQLF